MITSDENTYFIRSFDALGVPAEASEDPFEALQKARLLAGPGGVTVACGSLYLVGELMKIGR